MPYMADPKEKTAILVAAAIICGIRTAREDIKSSPRLYSRVAERIQLARIIWQRISMGE